MPVQTPESSLPRVHLSAVGYGGEDAWVPVARYNTPQGTGADLGPLFVFLHEGLGCIDMWRGFPQQVCEALGVEGLAYSRPGYGYATPRPAGEQWPLTFMHHQATVVLPALLKACDVDVKRRKVYLVGHSDGASIALRAAAEAPNDYAGVVAISLHVFVEAIGLQSIREARVAFDEGTFAARLAKYHPDPASPFDGWAGVWLHPEFEKWTMTSPMRHITAPILAIQGTQDPYGTMAQVLSLQSAAVNARHFYTLAVAKGGHDPHRDDPEEVIKAIRNWWLV
jgi:pimeloyl-ACP methyl ester carboxylesterase